MLLQALSLILVSLSAFAADKEPAPEEIRAKIHAPWTGSLLQLKQALKPNRSYVAWVLVPPHTPLDMRSANHFRHSYLATPPEQFSISHNLVAWNCVRKDGTRAEGGVAITGENDDQSVEMMKKGFGLTPLFSNFTDGELQGSADVSNEMDEEKSEHGHALVAFEVSADACENMLSFVDAFVMDPRHPYKNFSNLKSPENFEGGGCVTLAGALLHKAGVFSDLWPLFWRDFQVNRRLLGGNLPLPGHVEAPSWPWLQGRPYHVPRLELLTSNWNGREDNFVPLRLMDPELMLYSLRTLTLEYLRTVPAQHRAKEEYIYGHSALGYREVKSAVGPFYNFKEGYIKQHQIFPITDRFDPQTAAVSRAARRWFAEAEHDGLKARHVKVLKSPGLIFDRD